MKKLVTAVVALAFLGVSVATAVAAGPGSCGKGKVWNPDSNKCVSKPKGTDSGSHQD